MQQHLKNVKSMKKLNTKLTLNKESVTSLNDAQMTQIGGGVKNTFSCTCGPYCGPLVQTAKINCTQNTAPNICVGPPSDMSWQGCYTNAKEGGLSCAAPC
jgi:natural product precursor